MVNMNTKTQIKDYNKVPVEAGMYTLNGHEPVPCTDIRDWGQCFQSKDRIVAQTKLGKYFVSTVFLGVDHSWGLGRKPILFETMVFGGDDNLDHDWTKRYRTWDEAEAGHEIVVAKIKMKKAKK